jgi:hypothetical protein
MCRRGGARRRTAGGRTQAPRRQTGAAWNRAHSGFRRGLHTGYGHGFCQSRGPMRRGGVGEGRCAAAVLRATVASGNMGTHARYATARLGSWLKCSDSIKRSSRFQLIWDGSLGLRTGGGQLHAVKCSKGSHKERWGTTGFSGRSAGHLRRVRDRQLNNAALRQVLYYSPLIDYLLSLILLLPYLPPFVMRKTTEQ